jgi:PilZ domain-containing protein
MELIHENRRQDRRYQIEMELRYKLVTRGQLGIQGTGKTYDMSSGGILFESDQLLPVGSFVELSINWPVLLEDTCPLTLMVIGRVVRSDAKGSAIHTTRYEFLTRSRRAQAVPVVEKHQQYMT